MHKFSLGLYEVEIVCVFMNNVNGSTSMDSEIMWKETAKEWSDPTQVFWV